ncbi:hypothetical protein FCH28_01260 [Streptomyces piniterrae]|uniref:Esterase family protein n=1 Tax=Streptomyces piniterrae TaxID=2571125 RepID=A0A4V5MM86_9ACTN|nr:alpha/beta hydrolase-fold protein [Streptomyces piniterrae]TJZ58818.1 hypothetical protein FCH28_01260 [Streptomyces piniterrae]
MNLLRIGVTVCAVSMGLLASGGCDGSNLVGSSDAPALADHPEKANARLPKVRRPTGPRARFRTYRTTGADGTKIVKTKWRGRKSGYTGNVWAWVPPQYHQPRYAKSAFPVLIALPGAEGYPGNYWAGGDFRLQESIAEWSRQGRTLPFIVVMPVLNPEKKYYDASDIPGQPKMGSWLTEDVPDFARANFRTYDGRAGWAYMGTSSGGFAALKSVLQYPERFTAAIANGPDVAPDSVMWQGHPKEKQANDPGWLARRLVARKGPDVYLAFELGDKEVAIPKVRQFIKDHTRGPVHSTLFWVPGKHSSHNYIKKMADSLHWISERMQGPVPAG